MKKNSRHLKIILRIIMVLLTLIVLALPVTSVAAAPQIEISPTTGAVGTVVTVIGTNFESYRGDNLNVDFDSLEVAGSPIVVPQEGSFSFSFNVPEGMTPGLHSVRVRNQAGSALASSPFTIPQTLVAIAPVQGVVGTKLEVTGSGFYAGRVVTLYYYNQTEEKLGTVTAGDTGGFTYSFTIPTSAAGRHAIRGVNNEGESANAEFTVIPEIRLDSSSGAPGDILTLTGHGFASRNQITTYFGTQDGPPARASSQGSFEITVNVPVIRPGSYELRVIDAEGNSTKTAITVTSGARLDKDSGHVGSQVMVTGSGFSPNQSVSVFYDGVEIGSDQTDNNGSFTLNVSIPPSAAGTHVVSVGDASTTRELSFAVEGQAPPVPQPSLPVNQSQTRPETYFEWSDVTDFSAPVTYHLQVATDQNFADVMLDRQGLQVSQYTLKGDERLAARDGATGYYWRVRAMDAAYNTSEWAPTWSYHVAAPEVPMLTLPELDVRASSQVKFDWEDVISLNPPITYTLQIAADRDFSVILLEKTGISESEYVLTEEEELATVDKETPYYWRVKVTDSAQSESAWSDSWAFHVGFSFQPPTWLVWVLVGLGIIVIGFLAFWIGRRTAFYQDGI